MTFKAVLVLLVATLALSATPVFFTAPSIAASGGTTAAVQSFIATGPGGPGDACSSGDCTFKYIDSNNTYLFSISTSTDPGLVGLFGNIGTISGAVITTGQAFTVGPIVDTIAGVRQDAAVLLPAGIKFIINDGLGTAASNYFTADITSFDMTSIVVSNFLFNLGGVVNLANFAYTGTNTALQNLRDMAPGVLQENFTFAGTTNLTALFNPTGSPRNAAFSLSVNTVPEPRFYGLLLCGLLGVAGIAMRRRKAVNENA